MIQKLLEDHLHIQKTLNLLEKHYFEMVNGGNPDPGLMLSVIVYLQEYMEQVHHPMEDAIFSVLVKKKANTRELIKELITDHTEMEIITRSLRESLEKFKTGEHASKNELEKIIPTLLERLRHHIQVEEESIFPLANHVMTRQDWESIKSMIPTIEDPVFGKPVNHDYRLLYQAIDSMTGNHASRN